MENEKKEVTPDLSTCTTDELWSELRSRFNTAVLAYERDGKEEDSTLEGVWWIGGTSGALGVLRWADIRLQVDLEREIEKEYYEKREEAPEV